MISLVILLLIIGIVAWIQVGDDHLPDEEDDE